MPSTTKPFVLGRAWHSFFDKLYQKSRGKKKDGLLLMPTKSIK